MLFGLAGVAGIVVVMNIARTDTAVYTVDAARYAAPAVGGSAADAGFSAVHPSPATPSSSPASPAVLVNTEWVESMSAVTGIPQRALRAYAAADLIIDTEQPACGLGWNTLAGIGSVETGHGTHGGAALDAQGYPQPAIRGPALDGVGFAAIPDTDGGAWDSDTEWDRAVGPMQFIPSTWARWGADGNGDGIADPNQIDDAALAAARYLCHSGSMHSGEEWRRAVFSYNHLDSYVDLVAGIASAYGEAAARVG